MLDINTRDPEVGCSATIAAECCERISYKSRGDNLLTPSPINDSPTPSLIISSVSSTENAKMSLVASKQAAVAGGEAVKVCEVGRDCDMNNVSQSDESNDEFELFSCLEMAIPHAVTGEKRHESLLPYKRYSADRACLDEQGLPLEVNAFLDSDKLAVIENAMAENPTTPRLASAGDTRRSSSCDPNDTSSKVEFPPSRTTAFKSRKLAFCKDTVTTASTAPQGSEDDLSDSDSMYSVSNSDSILIQDQDNTSSPKSDSDSSTEGKGHCDKSKLIAELINSSTAQASSSSDSDDDSDDESDSSALDKGRGPCKPVHISDIFSSSKTQRGESSIAQTKGAAGKAVNSATLPAEKEGMRGRTTSTAPR